MKLATEDYAYIRITSRLNSIPFNSILFICCPDGSLAYTPANVEGGRSDSGELVVVVLAAHVYEGNANTYGWRRSDI